MSSSSSNSTGGSSSSSCKFLFTRLIEKQPPRAVAVVLGPLGASKDLLERYGKWYTDRKCNVVAAASPPGKFVLNMSLRPSAREILREAVTALDKTPDSVPLVTHSFSNGGAFLLEQMELILKDGDDAFTDAELSLVLKRLKKGYQFFDSCPCYIRLLWDWNHFGKSFPKSGWPGFVRTSYTAVASLSLTTWCLGTLSPGRARIFWQNMLDSKSCMNQVYAYTTADTLSDASAVDRLIEDRKQLHRDDGLSCVAYRYEDSGHCQLDGDHTDEYLKAIDDALEAAVQRAVKNTATTATAETK